MFSVPQYAGDILGEMGVLYVVPGRRCTFAFSQRMAFSIRTYRPIPYNLVHLLQTYTPMHNHEAMYFDMNMFDMNMSYTRVLHIKVAYRVPHK
jgi:hypothetical protein